VLRPAPRIAALLVAVAAAAANAGDWKTYRSVSRKLMREWLGKKGPTFFADISQPRRSRVLMLDPDGAAPRMGDARRTFDVELVRQVLDTLITFAVPAAY